MSIEISKIILMENYFSIVHRAQVIIYYDDLEGENNK